MKQPQDKWSFLVEEFENISYLIKTGARPVAANAVELLADSMDTLRRKSGENKEALLEWWDEPMSLTERVEDLRRTARTARSESIPQLRWAGARGSDIGRVVVANSRVQLHNSAYSYKQTYAPFMLALHEAHAGEVLTLLPKDRRQQLVPIAERIRSAQLSMLERTKGYRDCGLCERTDEGDTGGQCCSVWVGQWFRPIDGIFRYVLGERAPMWPRFHEDFSRCGYMGPTGCVLPPGARPIICVGYYCDDFRARLDEDGVWASLAPDFLEIRDGIRQLEFRFSMHKRFLTDHGPTIVGSSMGYLFDKLMTLYSAYDQIAPSQQPAGLDAITETEVAAENRAQTEQNNASETAPGEGVDLRRYLEQEPATGDNGEGSNGA